MSPTRKKILIVSAIVFGISSVIPAYGLGCLHHWTTFYGWPFGWFGVESKGGHIADVQIGWLMLPFELGGSLLAGSAIVGLAKGAAGIVRLLRNYW